MKIGIISDSHDNVEAIKKACGIIINAGCSLIIHAGDICSPFVAKVLKEAGVEVKAVFGNNDGDRVALSKMLDIRPVPRHLEVDGVTIVVFHEPFINDFIDPQKVDLLVYGHTHQKGISYKDKMIVLNPGTVSGVLAETKSLAIFDTKERKVEFIEI